uniref:Transposase (putative) gypsy type domain-containing protein n=1 Tax=Arundo donax TaxID=35708 RepID=A0A0A8YQ62_ARUDO
MARMSQSPGTTRSSSSTTFFTHDLAPLVNTLFHGQLHYYFIGLTHLNPNSILQIALFIHLCEAYIGIPPHFNLFRYLFYCKPQLSAARIRVVRGAGIQLRDKRSDKYFNLPLKKSLKGWHEEWFYMYNYNRFLPPFDGNIPVVNENWFALLSPSDMGQVNQLLDIIHSLKAQNLTAIGIAINFVSRRVQPLKDQIHLGFEIHGNSNLTHESDDTAKSQEIVS